MYDASADSRSKTAVADPILPFLPRILYEISEPGMETTIVSKTARRLP